MRPALVPGHSVDLIDNHALCLFKNVPAPPCSQKNKQRFRGGDQDVWWPPNHQLSLAAWRIAGADSCADRRQLYPLRLSQRQDAGKGVLEGLLNIVSQRLERRDVNDIDFLFEPFLDGSANQTINRPKKGCKGFSRSGRRGYEGIPSLRDIFPALLLRRGGSTEPFREPLPHKGMKGSQ